MFSVNVLVFGSHTDLAKRCLNSILTQLDTELVQEIRVGMNSASPETRDFVYSTMSKAPCPFYVYEETSGRNVMKYPMMRKMLYDTQYPVKTKNVMWFDDDSFIMDQERFWTDADAAFSRCRCPVMGSVYLTGFLWTPVEAAAIKKQKWYKGKDMSKQPQFVTGGWWVANMDFLREIDYPFLELQHNGGDTILGEVLRQRKTRVHHYREHVAINADEDGMESRAKRRGVTTKRPFAPLPPYDYTHQNFEVTVKHNIQVSKSE